MFWFMNQVLVTILGFSRSLTTKCMFLNDESCMIKLTLNNLNHIVPNYYPFMIGLDKCDENCNAVDDLSTKICVFSIKQNT